MMLPDASAFESTQNKQHFTKLACTEDREKRYGVRHYAMQAMSSTSRIIQ